MAGPIPHGRQFAQWTEEYLNDAEEAIRKAFVALKSSSDFRAIYQNSFAAHAVLSKLVTTRWRPAAHGIRCLLLRIPFIVASRQISLATVELRRLMELTFWVVYFTDHPIEWSEFESNPAEGFYPSVDNPIRFCAHRSLKFYIDYSAERLAKEPSGVAKIAVEELRKLSNELNSVVHPAHLSATRRKAPPFENISATALAKFGRLQKNVFRCTSIILAAIFRKQFDAFPAMHRAQFDWLIGKKDALRVRAGPFGIT